MKYWVSSLSPEYVWLLGISSSCGRQTQISKGISFWFNYEESWPSMDTWVAEFPDGVNSIEQLCVREAIKWRTCHERMST